MEAILLDKEKVLLEILKRAGCPDNVIAHIQAVKAVAMRLADEVRVTVDRELLLTGAMLHDIGRSRTHGIEHALVGARIARELGFPEAVIRIIERHIGSGITRQEAEGLGLPPRDYLPETVEEKLVAYADNLLNGDKEVSFEESLERFKKILGPEHPAIKRYIELHNEIESWKEK
ncbi:MAG: TIGR00295 family protein [Nitrospirae bacterium]|nr:MAG: TIGR00295 family protein [Nitrospirota bacterium]